MIRVVSQTQCVAVGTLVGADLIRTKSNAEGERHDPTWGEKPGTGWIIGGFSAERRSPTGQRSLGHYALRVLRSSVAANTACRLSRRQMQFGVGTARRGWVEPQQVLNARAGRGACVRRAQTLAWLND